MSKKKTNKLLLLGWDAAEWKIIEPMIKEGLMPTLKKFLEEGSSGKIQTLDPPFSPMLWTSIATGKRAYDHGIMGFIEPTPNGDALRPVMSTSRKVKAIWNILNQEGFKSNVIGWWPSHPAEPINGVMISNFIQNAKDTIDKPWPMPEGCVHPKELAEEFKKMRVHPDEITVSIMKNFIPDLEKIYEKYLPILQDEKLTDEEKQEAKLNIHRVSGVAKNLATCTTIHSAGTYVLQNTEWDFTAIYLDTIDHMCHIGMKFHPPKMKIIEQQAFDLYKDIVTAGYRFHDMMLERILEIVDEDTTIIIMSDHGFHPDHQRPKFLPKEPASPAMEHSPYGFFAIKGPGIKKGETIFGASLLDVTPTLLHLYGLPVGKDMEGKVLTQIFENGINDKVDFIDSWENVEGNDGRHIQNDQVDTWAAREAMQQLVDLGYVDKPDNENLAKAVEEATDEAKYYLARVYLDANNMKMAIPLLEELTQKCPNVIRYHVRLINAFMQSKKYKKCRSVIEHVKTIEKYPKFKIQFLEGLLELHTYRLNKAIKLFEELYSSYDQSPNLLVQIGKAYNMRYKFDESESKFRRVIELDAYANVAYQGLGYSLLRQNKLEEAAEAFLNSIEINNNIFTPHFYLGETLYKLGLFKQATEAFQMSLRLNPNHLKTNYWLALCYSELKEFDLAKKHNEIYEHNHKGNRIIVSGLRRTGTSLMMQILQKLGIDLVYDELKPADENNPNGYFEYQPALNLLTDKAWMAEIGPKAVKVYANRIPDLPAGFKYKIIWMDRDINEIGKSIRKLANKNEATFNPALAESMTKEVEKAQLWLESQPQCDLLIIDYNQLLTDPENEIVKIISFLELDTEKQSLNNIIENSNLKKSSLEK